MKKRTKRQERALDELVAESERLDLYDFLKPNPEFDRARSQANYELLVLLGVYLRDNPSQRFGQALNNLDLLENAPLAEPQSQLARAKAALERIRRAKT